MCSTFGCWSVSINCFARSAGTSEICRPRSTTRCSPSTSTPSSWLLSRAKRSRPRERRRSSFCAVSFAGFKSRRGGGCSRNQLVNSGLLAYYSKGRGGKVDGLARTARGPAVPTYDTEERQQLMEILGSLTGLQEGQLGWRRKRDSNATSLRNFHRYWQIASLFVVNIENGRGMQNRGFPINDGKCAISNFGQSLRKAFP